MIRSFFQFIFSGPVGWVCGAIFVAIWILCFKSVWELLKFRGKKGNFAKGMAFMFTAGGLASLAVLPAAIRYHTFSQEQQAAQRGAQEATRTKTERRLKELFTVRLRGLGLQNRLLQATTEFPSINQEVEQKIADGFRQLGSPGFILRAEADPTLIPTLLSAVERSTNAPQVKLNQPGATLTCALVDGRTLIIELGVYPPGQHDAGVTSETELLLIDSYRLSGTAREVATPIPDAGQMAEP